jgi:hypothetical protein
VAFEDHHKLTSLAPEPQTATQQPLLRVRPFLATWCLLMSQDCVDPADGSEPNGDHRRGFRRCGFLPPLSCVASISAASGELDFVPSARQISQCVSAAAGSIEDYSWKGLNISAPVGSKSLTLRVTTIRP